MKTLDKPATLGRGDAKLAPRILMCAPDSYDVKYEINDWMSIAVRPDPELAAQQWAELYRVLTEEIGVRVELVKQEPNAPDMVFTANAGLVRGDLVLLSHFRHSERQVEVAPFRHWFEEQGFHCEEPPDDVRFEGEGDALFAGDTLVAGYLKRSDIRSHQWLADRLKVPVLSLELTQGRWYHLDTAFVALTPNLVAYYPGAFDSYAIRVIENNFEAIRVADDEALHFACNAVVAGNHVVVPAGCPKLGRELARRGFGVHPVELSEYIKAGGAAKCLTLFLEERRWE